MQEIDARGLACPAPVLQTKAAVENEGATAVKVLVDNQASRQNVKRFLESQGFEVTLEEEGDDCWVVGRCEKAAATKADAVPAASGEQRKVMVMVATDRIGYGDDELGLKLMINFINTIKEMGHQPSQTHSGADAECGTREGQWHVFPHDESIHIRVSTAIPAKKGFLAVARNP